MSKGNLFFSDFDVIASPGFLSLSRSNTFRDLPGSAIAEKIFNDPDSWEDASGDEADYPEDIENDTVAWLSEEVEKFRVHSAGVGGFELANSEKKSSKDLGLIPKVEANAGWKSISRRSAVRPISLAGLFEQSNDDFSKEIQLHLSKILDSSGIKHHIGPRPVSSTPHSASGLSAPTTADSTSTLSTPSTSNTDDLPSAPCPPSATLSFLGFYGIYPESPIVDGTKSLLPRKKTVRKPKNDAISRNESLSTVTLPAKSTPPKRRSSIPPPALDLNKPSSDSPTEDLELRKNPPGLTQPARRIKHELPTPPHSRNNSRDQDGMFPRSDTSPRSRPLPTAAPPPYKSATPSSRPATPNIPSTSPKALPTTSTTPIRRLPSLPSEAWRQTYTPTTSSPLFEQVNESIASRLAGYPTGLGSRRVATPPPSSSRPLHTPPRQSSASALSPPAKTSAAWSFASLSNTSSPQTPQTSLWSARSSVVRSPLSVPLGPRTRARSSDAGRPIATL